MPGYLGGGGSGAVGRRVRGAEAVGRGLFGVRCGELGRWVGGCSGPRRWPGMRVGGRSMPWRRSARLSTFLGWCLCWAVGLIGCRHGLEHTFDQAGGAAGLAHRRDRCAARRGPGGVARRRPGRGGPGAATAAGAAGRGLAAAPGRGRCPRCRRGRTGRPGRLDRGLVAGSVADGRRAGRHRRPHRPGPVRWPACPRPPRRCVGGRSRWPMPGSWPPGPTTWPLMWPWTPKRCWWTRPGSWIRGGWVSSSSTCASRRPRQRRRPGPAAP